MAVLLISVVFLFLLTVVTLNSSKGAISEQASSGLHYKYHQAFEAAYGGLDYALAWLSDADNTKGAPWTTAPGGGGAVWVADTTVAPYNQVNTTSIASQTLGAFSVAITLRRDSAKPSVIALGATATGDASATVSSIVNVINLAFNTATVSPLVVNGSISGVTGNPSIVGTDPAGVSVTSSATAGNIDMGGMSYTGTVQSSAFADTAWNYVFGISKAEMAQLASAQTGGPTAGPIYYYNDSTVGTYAPASIGTSTGQIILIFDISTGDCPKINGGRTIWGLVYCGTGFDMQGWGGTVIHGAMITDMALTKFTANTILMTDVDANTTTSYSAAPVVSKLVGSWRDF